MAGTTSYPGGIDDFAAASPTNLGDDDTTGRVHSERHDDMEAAMEAVQSYAVSRTLADAKGDLLAATASDTVTRLPVGTVGQVLGVDATASTGLAWRSSGATNLLTANQASLETDATGWAAGTNCTISRSTAQYATGAASLALTSTAAGDMNAATPSGTSGVKVTAGRVYTAVASVRAAVSARSTYMTLNWYTAAGTYISQTIASGTAESASAWVEKRATGTAPATAAYANVEIVVPATGGASEVHYVDAIGLWEGPGGSWALPGEPIQGLGTYWDESVGRRQFAWDSVNARWQMVYGDTGWRDVSAGLINSYTGTLYIRRLNWTVHVIAYNLAGDNTSSAYALPNGFRAYDASSGVVVPGTTGATAFTWNFNLPGAGAIYPSVDTGGTALTTVQVPTGDAWPTSLPGTAVGSIPTG